MKKEFKDDTLRTCALFTILIFIVAFASFVKADNDVTNSHNINESTQSNVIDQHDTYYDESTSTDSSVDNSEDNSENSHNAQDSYNQANQSWQTINNTNTEGDLSKSKNTGSFNVGSYNTDTSGSGNNLTASGGDQAQKQGQGQGQGQGQAQGQDVKVKTGKTVFAPSTVVNNKNRTIPVSTAVSMGQVAHTPYSCDPINGGAVQTHQVGISLNISRKDGFCRGMVYAEVMTQHYNLPQVGCTIIEETAKDQDDDIVGKALKSHKIDCHNLVPIVNGKSAVVGAAFGAPSMLARDTEARLDSLRPINPAISGMHSAIMRK
jgi:hypothetical protein